MLLRIFLVLFSLFFWMPDVIASPLAQRLEQYPKWHNKPPVKIAQGDLSYPDWLAGTWNATSTLVEQTAPLAPEIVTPGFEDNQRYIGQPVEFSARFGTEYFIPQKSLFSKLSTKAKTPQVVADRVYNGTNIARAYLGADNILRVQTDPDNPNKQITFLKGDRKLSSQVSARASENPQSDHFIASEVTKQLFRSPERIYLNEVETTSDYHQVDSGAVEATQITAIYLSPQDPDYFRAKDRPVAIYRYRLQLHKL